MTGIALNLFSRNVYRPMGVKSSVADPDPVFLGHPDPDPDPLSTKRPL